MQLNLHFRLEEKIDYLRKHGYEVKLEKVEMSWNVYHDDVETKEVEVWTVHKEGIEFERPSSRSFSREEWLDDAFETVIMKRFKEFLIQL